MEHNRQNFFSFWTFFCPFTPPPPKITGDIIILHKRTINENHVMYGFRDMKPDRQNFLSFWAIFFPFYPTNNPKGQNFEKMKTTPGDIVILHKCTKNHDHMLYCS